MVRCSVGQRTHFSWSMLVQGIQPVKCITKYTGTQSTTCIQQHNHLPTHISTNVMSLLLVFVERLVPQKEIQKWFRNSKQIHLVPASVSLSMLGNNSHGSIITTAVKLCSDRNTAKHHQICPEPCVFYFNFMQVDQHS